MAHTLYIIGNGFDRYHRLDTRYQSFALFLKEKYYEIYELFIQYYGLPDLDGEDASSYYDPLWADFENALAGLDFETVLEDNKDYLANPSSPDFRDRDWHAYQFEMEAIVDKLTKEMAKAFKEFILAVSFPDDVDDVLIELERNSIYLTFNYTDTLEKYYGIKLNKILYIHGKAKNSVDKIILGHGVHPSTFEEKEEVPPAGLDEEQMEMWREYQENKHEYSYDAGKSELMSYFKQSYKSTEEIIAQSGSFFTNLKEVKKIIVLGHSLAEVDQPYFRKIIQCLTDKSIPWFVSYYSETERDSHLDKLVSLGLDKTQITMIKMDSLKPKLLTLF